MLAIIAFGNGTLVIPVNPEASLTISVTVRTIPVGDDGIAVLFMFSFIDVADTSSQVPAFNSFCPSQLMYIEKFSLSSIYDFVTDVHDTALSNAC